MTYSPDEHEDRRKFLKACGKFAAVTPPALTLLLSTSLTSTAIAHSGAGGSYGDKGGHSIFDNGPDDPHEHSGSDGRNADGRGGGQGGGGQGGGGGGDGVRTAGGGSSAYDTGGGGGTGGGDHPGPDGNDDGNKRHNDKGSRGHR